MTFVPQRRTRRFPMSGLGDVQNNCGYDQVLDPNIVAGGFPQCMPRANYQPSQLVDPTAYPGVVKSKSSSSSGGGLASVIGALLSNATKPPAPTYQYPTTAPSSGMSTGTLLMIGALGLGAVYLATK